VDSGGIIRERGRAQEDDVESLVTEVGGAEFIEPAMEPRGADERYALDLEDAQGEHGAGAGCHRSRFARLAIIAVSAPKPIAYPVVGAAEVRARRAHGIADRSPSASRTTRVVRQSGAIVGSSASGPAATYGASTPTRGASREGSRLIATAEVDLDPPARLAQGWAATGELGDHRSGVSSSAPCCSSRRSETSCPNAVAEPQASATKPA
jgi:hypothetical protein